MDKLIVLAKQNKHFVVAIILVLIFCIVVTLGVIGFIYTNKKAENLSSIYLDNIGNEFGDPLLFKYDGDQRDITGMSSRDYYLENQMNYSNLTGPAYMKGNAAFVDHTNYAYMPKQYRPMAPASATATMLYAKRSDQAETS